MDKLLLITCVRFSAIALAIPLLQVSSGVPGGIFGPDGPLGSLLQGMVGNITNGPAPKGCSKYEMLVAHGTGEPGPFGIVVGDTLVASVTKALPESRAYAVQYPAIWDFEYSPQIGMDDVINRLNKQSKECPEQTFSIIGYSQGASVWHLAMGLALGAPLPKMPPNRPKLDESVIPKIKTAVMFGDPGFKGDKGPTGLYSPLFPGYINAILKNNCAPGDPVCDPAGSKFQHHMVYVQGAYQNDSVAFILASFTGEVLPKSFKTSIDTECIALSEKVKTESKPWGTVTSTILMNWIKALLPSSFST